MNIGILATGDSAKESFLQSLAGYGFDINRLPRLTEAIFLRENNFTIVTITKDGEIAIFSKTGDEEEGLQEADPVITTFDAPKTALGYNAALTETKKAISL